MNKTQADLLNKFGELDHKFMRRAIDLAAKAADAGEVPVGAVLVRDGLVIGEGHNRPISTSDTTAHAEIIALRQANTSEKNYRLPGSTLYVTLEPCSMCAGALVHARVERVVIAAKEPRAGAAGSVLNILNHQSFNHLCQVDFGLYEEESARLLKTFFKQKREQAKANKQAKELNKEGS